MSPPCEGPGVCGQKEGGVRGTGRIFAPANRACHTHGEDHTATYTAWSANMDMVFQPYVIAFPKTIMDMVFKFLCHSRNHNGNNTGIDRRMTAMATTMVTVVHTSEC